MLSLRLGAESNGSNVIPRRALPTRRRHDHQLVAGWKRPGRRVMSLEGAAWDAQGGGAGGAADGLVWGLGVEVLRYYSQA